MLTTILGQFLTTVNACSKILEHTYAVFSEYLDNTLERFKDTEITSDTTDTDFQFIVTFHLIDGIDNKLTRIGIENAVFLTSFILSLMDEDCLIDK